MRMNRCLSPLPLSALLVVALAFLVGVSPVAAQSPPAGTSPADAPATPAPPQGKPPYIAVDPGHGDKDTGAVGVLAPGTVTGLPERADSQGRAVLYEKDVNFDIAQRLDRFLRRWGARTIMTRTGDRAGGDRPFTTTTDDLKARTDLANEVGVDLFVSIHNNSLGSPQGTGTETFHYYYASEASKRLALSIQTELVATLGLPDRGVKEAGFYVLRHTVMPAVLVEGAFLTNPGDLAKLASPVERERIARAVGRGVQTYWNNGPSEEPVAVLPPTIGPWVSKPKRVPDGYVLVKTGKANPVGKGGWLAVRADIAAAQPPPPPATIGPWRLKPKRVPDGYRLVKTGKANPIGRGGWLAVLER
ncbi:MAG TPA: N-acetylmuramoyl-L-alanine amidase [Miltoncostaeaceae bacterium]|nr:N-acetylmuramoyl-L-alanine amidase [Miltoncostaeaceae bacterium]